MNVIVEKNSNDEIRKTISIPLGPEERHHQWFLYWGTLALVGHLLEILVFVSTPRPDSFGMEYDVGIKSFRIFPGG